MSDQPYDLLIPGGTVIDGSGAPAFRLEGRGEVREGWFADLVVFDSAAVEDAATYEEPRRHAHGIEYVIVNGEEVVKKGKQTQARPGRALRRGEGG